MRKLSVEQMGTIMKYTMNILALIFGVLLANMANAESPREQIKQMDEQL